MNGDNRFITQERIDMAELRRAINALIDDRMAKLDELEARMLKENKAEPIRLDDAAIDADVIGGNEK